MNTAGINVEHGNGILGKLGKDLQRSGLSKTRWQITHRIECPLSSERLSGNQVQRMQNKRILGTVGRTLLVAKRL